MTPAFSARETRETSLYDAILSLKNRDEVRSFLADLCTPAEITAFTERWLVAGLLNQKKPYRQVSEETGVSLATVTRVARFLHHEHHHGYQLVLNRLNPQNQNDDRLSEENERTKTITSKQTTDNRPA